MITWHPIQEVPTDAVTTAMIRCTDLEGDPYLLPGPVMWTAARSAWVNEDSGKPLRLDPRHGAFHWALECEIAGEVAA